MFPQNFTNKSQDAIQNSQSIATQNGQMQIEPTHLFLSLLNQDEGVVVSIFKKLNVNIEQLKTEVQEMISSIPKQNNLENHNIGQVTLGQAMIFILQNADNEAKRCTMSSLVLNIYFLLF